MKASADNLADYLGVPKYRYGEVEDQIGIVTGLAWTDVGGELLTIEAAMMAGKGKMIVTGNLRDVMKESISAAASFVRMALGALRAPRIRIFLSWAGPAPRVARRRCLHPVRNHHRSECH